MTKNVTKNTAKNITKKEFDTWEKLECIGKGTYGKVYRYHKSGKEVAVKRMHLHGEHDMNSYVAYKELTLMRSLSHPNVMGCKQWYISDNNKLYVFMKYMNESSLKRIMFNGKYIPYKLKLKIISQIISGLSYLHSRDIVHRDIRPDNIFIHNSIDYEVKIGDYSISDPLRSINYSYEWNAFPFTKYRPPEGLYYGVEPIITPKTDIWSLGVVMFMLLTENNLFVGFNDRKIVREIAVMLGKPNSYNWPSFNIDQVQDQLIRDLYKYLPNTKKYSDFWGKVVNVDIKDRNQWIYIFESMFRYDPMERISSSMLSKNYLFSKPYKPSNIDTNTTEVKTSLWVYQNIIQTETQFMKDVFSTSPVKIDSGNIQRDFLKYMPIISDFGYSLKTISTATFLYKLHHKQLGENKLYPVSCMHISSMMREKYMPDRKDYGNHYIGFGEVRNITKKQLKLMNYNIIPVCPHDYLVCHLGNEIFNHYPKALFQKIRTLSRYILVFLGFIHRYSLLDSKELSHLSLSLAHIYYDLVYNGPKCVKDMTISEKDFLFIDDDISYNIALALESALKSRYKNKGPNVGIENFLKKINI